MTADQRSATGPTDHRDEPAAPGAARSPQRRAALVATAIALPVTVVLAFLFSSGGSSRTSTNPNTPLPALTVVAPPSPDAATRAACAKVFAQLPVRLDGLAPRSTNSDSSFVAAWGEPAIVIRCGVGRPAVFDTPNAAQPIGVNGVLWQPDPQSSQVVYTAVDRSVYVEVTVPTQQDQPLPALAPALAALPARCTGADASGQTDNPALPTCR